MVSIKCGAERVVQYELVSQGVVIGKVDGRQSGNGVVKEAETIKGCRRCVDYSIRRCDLNDGTNGGDLTPQPGGYIS